MSNLKTCTKCSESKTEDEFYASKVTKNGLTSACKQCIDAINKDWRSRNPEKVSQIQREWREANEGHTYYEGKSGYVVYIGYSSSSIGGHQVSPHRPLGQDEWTGCVLPLGMRNVATLGPHLPKAQGRSSSRPPERGEGRQPS